MPILSGAYNIVINNSQLIDNCQSVLEGIQILLKSSAPNAAAESQCLWGTREHYISEITDWGKHLQPHAVNDIVYYLMWMNGPAGAGKTAVAQSCADRLARTKSLGAAFFFRTRETDDHNLLFTTIAYQLSIKNSAYADSLNSKILRDPTLVTKSIKTQFHEFFVAPFQDPSVLDFTKNDDFPNVLGPRVIIIDGLDECRDETAQREIVELIADSVRAQTTPFLWAIFSRPETHLISTFSSSKVNDLCWTMTLTVSTHVDQDIEAYLRHGFLDLQTRMDTSLGPSTSTKPPWPSPRAIQNIVKPSIGSLGLQKRADNLIGPATDTMPSWPSPGAIKRLVKKSDGLFIYAATVLRYLSDPDVLDPEKELQNLLDAPDAEPQTDTQKPLSALDRFYTVIMERIPSHILPQILLILFAYTSYSMTSNLTVISNTLGLSFMSAFKALSKLASVIALRRSEMFASGARDVSLHFFHTSFHDFLRDPKRSRTFCVMKEEYATLLAKSYLRIITQVHTGTGCESIQLSNWDSNRCLPDQQTKLQTELYNHAASNFLTTCAHANLSRPDSEEIIIQLCNLDYHRIFHTEEIYTRIERRELTALIKTIPEQYRNRIIRIEETEVYEHSGIKHRGLRPAKQYWLGEREKRVLVAIAAYDVYDDPSTWVEYTVARKPTHPILFTPWKKLRGDEDYD